jgi:hypothetical protein
MILGKQVLPTAKNSTQQQQKKANHSKYTRKVDLYVSQDPSVWLGMPVTDTGQQVAHSSAGTITKAGLAELAGNVFEAITSDTPPATQEHNNQSAMTIDDMANSLAKQAAKSIELLKKEATEKSTAQSNQAEGGKSIAMILGPFPTKEAAQVVHAIWNEHRSVSPAGKAAAPVLTRPKKEARKLNQQHQQQDDPKVGYGVAAYGELLAYMFSAYVWADWETIFDIRLSSHGLVQTHDGRIMSSVAYTEERQKSRVSAN